MCFGQATSDGGSNICQCLRACDMSYVHLSIDVFQWKVASEMSCIHWFWCVCIGWATFTSSYVKQNNPRMVCFRQETLANSRRHKLWRVGIDRTVSTSTDSWQYQPRPICFGKATLSNDKTHWPGILVIHFRIDRGLCTCSTNVDRVSAASVVDVHNTQWSWGFACTHCPSLLSGQPMSYMGNLHPS